MKQRSTKATKRVDRWVDLRRKRVRTAHAAARTETMKRVLRGGCVSVGHRSAAAALWVVWSAYRIEAEVSRLAFWLASTKYAWYGQCRPQTTDSSVVVGLTSMPSVGMSVTISHSRQKVKKIYPSMATCYLESGWRLMRRM